MNPKKLRPNLRGRLPNFDYRSAIRKKGGCPCLGCLSQLLCLVRYRYRFLPSLLRIVWRIAKKGVGAREIIAKSNVTRNASNGIADKPVPRSTRGEAYDVRYWPLADIPFVRTSVLSGVKRTSAPLRRGWRNLITIRWFGIGRLHTTHIKDKV